MKDRERPTPHSPEASPKLRRRHVDPADVHVHQVEQGFEPGEHIVTLAFRPGGRVCSWPRTDDVGALGRALKSLGAALVEHTQLAEVLAGVDLP